MIVWLMTVSYSSFVQSEAQGPMQRWIKYSRHGRGSSPVITFVQERQGNSFLTRSNERRTDPAEANGPK